MCSDVSLWFSFALFWWLMILACFSWAICAICISSVKCLFLLFFTAELRQFTLCFKYQFLTRHEVWKYFLLVCKLPFLPIYMDSSKNKLFRILIRSNLPIFWNMFLVVLRTLWLPKILRFSPLSSCLLVCSCSKVYIFIFYIQVYDQLWVNFYILRCK